MNTKIYERNPILKLLRASLLTNTDSYKFSQDERQYAPGVTNAFAYVAPRGVAKHIQEIYDKYLPHETPLVVFAGLQPVNLEYLSRRITHQHIDEAIPYIKMHGFELNEAGWRHIVDNCDGYLPIKISAPPEGTTMEPNNIMVAIEATDGKSFWLESHIETILVRAIWYMSTIASKGLLTRKILTKYMIQTSDYDLSYIDYMSHDFGARAATSSESAELADIAHLIHSSGTDTFAGTLAAMDYYFSEEMPGHSVNASQHSVASSWGPNREKEYVNNMIDQFIKKEGDIVSIVGDTYHIYNMATNIFGKELKEKIIKIGVIGGKVVLRPDSGNPLTVPINIIERLMDAFGYTVNSKGYKQLPPYIGVLQGDGINISSMAQILENMANAGLAASNIVFGQGDGISQDVGRDDFKFAQKESATFINGEWRDSFKAPVDDTTKNSLIGRLTLVENKITGRIHTVRIETGHGYHERDIMNIVYYNKPLPETFVSFPEVRAVAAKYATLSPETLASIPTKRVQEAAVA